MHEPTPATRSSTRLVVPCLQCEFSPLDWEARLHPPEDAHCFQTFWEHASQVAVVSDTNTTMETTGPLSLFLPSPCLRLSHSYL